MRRSAARLLVRACNNGEHRPQPRRWGRILPRDYLCAGMIDRAGPVLRTFTSARFSPPLPRCTRLPAPPRSATWAGLFHRRQLPPHLPEARRFRRVGDNPRGKGVENLKLLAECRHRHRRAAPELYAGPAAFGGFLLSVALALGFLRASAEQPARRPACYQIEPLRQVGAATSRGNGGFYAFSRRNRPIRSQFADCRAANRIAAPQIICRLNRRLRRRWAALQRRKGAGGYRGKHLPALI